MTETKTAERAEPEAITAVPVRHPPVGRDRGPGDRGRDVCHMLVTNEAFQWRFMLDNMFRPAVIEGVRTTLIVTVLAMIIGVALGIVIAMMRLSPTRSCPGRPGSTPGSSAPCPGSCC